MWVQTKTDPVTLVNLDHASVVVRTISGKIGVIAMIAGKSVLLADCDPVEAADAVLRLLAARMQRNPPVVDLTHV